MEGVAPMCPSCNHAHFPEVKCAVCGHKGKGQAYLLIAKVYKSRVALARILRRRVFVEECLVPEEQEFDAHDDAHCRHVLGLVGDAPVVYCRWRLEKAGSGDGSGSGTSSGLLAVIDRLAVLPSHRGRGFSSRALEFLLADVEETARGMGMDRVLAGVAATVPVALGALGEKLRGRWGFEVVGAPFVERNATSVRMLRQGPAGPQPVAT